MQNIAFAGEGWDAIGLGINGCVWALAIDTSRLFLYAGGNFTGDPTGEFNYSYVAYANVNAGPWAGNFQALPNIYVSEPGLTNGPVLTMYVDPYTYLLYLGGFFNGNGITSYFAVYDIPSPQWIPFDDYGGTKKIYLA